jgi:hypothetical protein
MSSPHFQAHDATDNKNVNIGLMVPLNLDCVASLAMTGVGSVTVLCSRPLTQIHRRFLLLFFKKEALACLT